MEHLISILIIFITTGAAGVASYFLSTRKGSAQDQAQDQTHQSEITRLEDKITALEAVVAHQDTEIARLNVFEELYSTLKEAHESLKQNHEELKEKFEAREAALAALRVDLDSKATRLSDLEKQNADLFEANKHLSARVSAYEHVFRLQGVVMQTANAAAKSDTNAQESVEVVTPASAPEMNEQETTLDG